MMDKRTTLALLLMAALLMIYPAIFMRGQETDRAGQKTEAPAPAPAAKAPGSAATPALLPADVPVPPMKEVPAVFFPAGTPVYLIVFSSAIYPPWLALAGSVRG